MFRKALEQFGIRIVGEEFWRWLNAIHTYQFEAFLDMILEDVADLLNANRISLLRYNESQKQWISIASTGVFKMTGVYELDDIPNGDPVDGFLEMVARDGVGNDVTFTFLVPYGKSPCHYLIGIDDTESARNYLFREDELKMICSLLRETILLKMMILHSKPEPLDERAYIDDLTQLPNRRAWEEKTRKLPEPLEDYFFAMIDIDYFKKINDEYGHAAGDAVLVFFAQNLRKMQEIYPGSFFARMGGEEFALCMPGSKESLEKLIGQLRLNVVQIDNIERKLTFSAGICPFEKELYSAEGGVKNMIDAADVALYAAKNSGRNRHAWVNNPKAFMGLKVGENVLDCARKIGAF